MIKAAHSSWFEQIFHAYIFRLLRKSFAGIYLYGEVPVTDPEVPIVLVPNHSAWWDGFFIYLLNVQVFERPLYLMMTEEQLQSFRFFAKVGAYSISLESRKGIMESLEYTLELLGKPVEPAPLICIFPQGELTSWFRRPLGFRRGLEWILTRHKGDVSLIPVAMKAEFCAEQRPEMFFLFGEHRVLTGPEFPGIQWLEQEIMQLLDKLIERMKAEQPDTLLLEGSASVHTRYRQFKKWFT